MKICEELRQAVLQAAIQGKLTRQRKEDGDARELLAQIAEEKAKLIKNGQIKKEKPMSAVHLNDEFPFDIPDNWQWARFCDVTINRDSERIPLSKASREHLAKVYDYYGASGVIDKVDNYLFDAPLILIGEDGANLLARSTPIAFIANGKYWVNNHAHVLDVFEGIYMEYFCLFINAIDLSPYVSGTAQPKMNQENMNSIWVCIPPLSEQHRIVAKVEKLMAAIDELEKVENELLALKASFPGDMKAALLQAAMQGKLTTQRKEDGDARELLAQIAEEKARLIKEKKIKKEKPLPEIGEEEIPFDIPENWVWCRLGEVTYNSGQKTPDTEFCYIDIGSINNKRQVLSELENIIKAENAPSRARKLVQFGDILYSTVRPYLHNMAIIDRKFSCQPIASTGFAVFTCFKSIYNKYLFYYLLSPDFDNYANDTENAKGVAYPAISDKKLSNSVIPLPPLAEQQRIVAKLEQLLPLCEALGEE